MANSSKGHRPGEDWKSYTMKQTSWRLALGGSLEGSNIFSEDGWQYGISQTLVQTRNDQYKIATLFPVDESRKNLPDRLQLHHGLTRHDYV